MQLAPKRGHQMKTPNVRDQRGGLAGGPFFLILSSGRWEFLSLALCIDLHGARGTWAAVGNSHFHWDQGEAEIVRKI